MLVYQAFVATTGESRVQRDAKGNNNNKGSNNRSKGVCGCDNNKNNNETASFKTLQLRRMLLEVCQ